jgi:hypothetical protein
MRRRLSVAVVVLRRRLRRAIDLSRIPHHCRHQAIDRLYRRMGLRRVLVHMSMARIVPSSILLMDTYGGSRRPMASQTLRIR